jgi:hypothetical protein
MMVGCDFLQRALLRKCDEGLRLRVQLVSQVA